MRFYEVPDTLTAEQDQFEQDIFGFIDGKIDPVKFKAIRVAHGVYEQRQNHTYMIRIRCAAGGITPAQLKKTAELAQQYGSGEVHFTTRQEVQVHNVLIDDVMKVIRGLNEVGLSSRGGGGNTIRNILTSPDSGVSENESFDVDPYAIALTTRLIAEPDSWNLPRKFKIAMSNSPEDTSYTQSTCLGYVAVIKDGQKGFEVYCAGGMGAKPMVGHELLGFVPESKVYHVARAIKTMFDKHGSRRNRFSNRIKFLWRKIGRDGFMPLFEEEYNKIKDDESLNLELPEIKNEAKPTDLPVEEVTSSEFELWKKRYVVPQRQKGLNRVKLTLRLGDLLYKDAILLCDFLDNFGDNTIRCERGQNMMLRNIPDQYLGNLYNIIQNMGQHLNNLPFMLGSMINCTGAQTCKLGICLPRGLSDAIRDELSASDLDLDAISELRINASGCPNTCGMHHIADIGFFGKVGRKDGEIFPSYNLLLGAKVGVSGQTEYAQREGEVAAHFIPNFLVDFLRDYIAKKDQSSSFREYLDQGGREFAKSLCEKYKAVPTIAEDPSFYKDYNAKEKLSLDALGTAECSAGMFDMIDVDKKKINAAVKQLEAGAPDNEAELLYTVLFHASRMLLVTRGLDGKTPKQVFEFFGKHFVDAEIVNAKYKDVVALGRDDKRSELSAHKDLIVELGSDIQELYKNMDDSLRFKNLKTPVEAQSDSVKPDGLSPKADTSKDLRGVACPMNFVKAKLVLEPMAVGSVLELLLDDGEPIQNVPNSLKLEGHKIVEQTRQSDGHWKVIVQKG